MDITQKLEHGFAGIEAVRSGPFNSHLHNEYDRQDMLRSIIAPNVLVALHKARMARELAVSYRNFNVGASVVALTKQKAGFHILPGFNVKTNADGPVNVHAEQSALTTAQSVNADMVSIVAVVGETQADQQSGHEMHTLHPCGMCRTQLESSPLVDNDATLIFSALPDLRTIEVSTVNGLHNYHNNTQPDRSGVTLFELPDLELLKPFITPRSGIIRLDDSERLVDEDRIWGSSIGAYVIEHQIRLQEKYSGTAA